MIASALTKSNFLS